MGKGFSQIKLLMFTYAYQILKLRLQADVTELREIEWYTEQDTRTAMLKAAPALYIEFLPNQPRTMSGQRIQSAASDFNLHLLTECVFDDDRRMKKDQPQDHMRIFDKIFRSIQGFSAKVSFLPEFVGLLNTTQDQRIIGSVDRVSITPPHSPRKAMMKSIQRFSGIIYDHGAASLYTTIADPPAQISTTVSLPAAP